MIQATIIWSEISNGVRFEERQTSSSGYILEIPNPWWAIVGVGCGSWYGSGRCGRNTGYWEAFSATRCISSISKRNYKMAGRMCCLIIKDDRWNHYLWLWGCNFECKSNTYCCDSVVRVVWELWISLFRCCHKHPECWMHPSHPATWLSDVLLSPRYCIFHN